MSKAEKRKRGEMTPSEKAILDEIEKETPNQRKTRLGLEQLEMDMKDAFLTQTLDNYMEYEQPRVEVKIQHRSETSTDTTEGGDEDDLVGEDVDVEIGTENSVLMYAKIPKSVFPDLDDRNIKSRVFEAVSNVLIPYLTAKRKEKQAQIRKFLDDHKVAFIGSCANAMTPADFKRIFTEGEQVGIKLLQIAEDATGIEQRQVVEIVPPQ
jgi:hypothetical protein